MCVCVCVYTWKSPNGVKRIDYILTNRPDIVANVTVINQDTIGSDHSMDMSNIKLDVQVKRKKLSPRGHQE